MKYTWMIGSLALLLSTSAVYAQALDANDPPALDANDPPVLVPRIEAEQADPLDRMDDAPGRVDFGASALLLQQPPPMDASRETLDMDPGKAVEEAEGGVNAEERQDEEREPVVIIIDEEDEHHYDPAADIGEDEAFHGFEDGLDETSDDPLNGEDHAFDAAEDGLSGIERDDFGDAARPEEFDGL